MSDVQPQPCKVCGSMPWENCGGGSKCPARPQDPPISWHQVLVVSPSLYDKLTPEMRAEFESRYGLTEFVRSELQPEAIAQEGGVTESMK